MTLTITFDQPLWLKAVTIVNCHRLKIVCWHSAFHAQMSILGSIGTLMVRSGLAEAKECCYAPNTVKHIIAGNAVSRGTHAQFLVESALRITLLGSASAGESKLQAMNDFYNNLFTVGFKIG